MQEQSNTNDTKNIWFDYFKHTSNKINPKILPSIREKYQISDAEEILEIYYNKHGLIKDCVLIISNYAIYFGETRLDLNNLCKYVLIKDGTNYYICTVKSAPCILCPISAYSANDSIDLYNRIISMQNYCYNVLSEAKLDRKKLYKDIATYAQNTVTKYKLLDSQTLEILSAFLNEEDFSIYSAELLIKNSILCGQISSINYYIKILERHYDLSNITTWFTKYLTGLSDFCASHEYNLSLCNRKNVESYTCHHDHTHPIQILLDFYAKVHVSYDILHGRFNNIPELTVVLNSSNFTDSDYNNFLLLWDKNVTPLMLDTYNIIKTNSIIESKKTLSKADSYGLTPYHYAILHNNKTLLLKLTNDDVFYNAINSEDETVRILYDPLFVSHFCNNDILFDLLIQIKSEHKALVKTFNTIQKKIKNAISTTNFFESINSSASNSIQSKKHIQQYITNIKKFYSNITNIKATNYTQLANEMQYFSQLKEQQRILKESGHLYDSGLINNVLLSYTFYLCQELYDVASEISELCTSYKQKYSEYVYIFKSNSDPFIKVLLQLYSSPEIIPEHYDIKTEKAVIKFYSNTFIVDKNWVQSYYQTNRTNETHSANSSNTQNWFKPKIKLTDIKKPYDKHWFSPSARKDLAILKKEYRKLALKYHPDTQNYASEVFIDIQSEREKIIEQLSH